MQQPFVPLQAIRRGCLVVMVLDYLLEGRGIEVRVRSAF